MANDVGVVNYKREQIGEENVYWIMKGSNMSKDEKRPT
jgi:hypothetical protein